MPLQVLVHRIALLGLLLGPWAAVARDTPGPAARNWLSDLVTRIDAADRADRRTGSGRRAGTVVVHLAIAADGAVRQAEIAHSSGSPALDRRALRAIQALGPLTAPPAGLLSGSGMADLSIPVDLGR